MYHAETYFVSFLCVCSLVFGKKIKQGPGLHSSLLVLLQIQISVQGIKKSSTLQGLVSQESPSGNTVRVDVGQCN